MTATSTVAAEVQMPRLSDSMEEGVILTWLKQVGESVSVGDELVEIETDKANMVYGADAAGTLLEILAEEGESRPVGAVIARIGDPSHAAAGAAADSADPSPAPAVASAAADEGDAPPRNGSGRRVNASPIARRMADKRGLDLSSIAGSGPGGRITKADVAVRIGGDERPGDDQPSAATPAAEIPSRPVDGAGAVEGAKGTTQVVELSKLQQTVSRRMAESKAVSPHFYLQTDIDMTAAWEARGRIKTSASEGAVIPSFNDIVVKACALALRELPRANGSYRDGRWELHSRVNVGIAVSASEALVVPTIFDADRKGLTEIASESRELAGKVRDQTVTPPELSSGTFTVSNLGMYGITSSAAVINQPQAAILAVGAITETPVVRNGEIITARMMGVTLSCDHRILYGAEGAELLARIRDLLEEPLSLAL